MNTMSLKKILLVLIVLVVGLPIAAAILGALYALLA